MTDKPTSKQLAQGAKQFVKENKAYLREYVTPLLIPLLLAQALEKIGPVYWHGCAFVAAFMASYFNACLMLAWHRAAILGPKREHAVNPFALKPGEGKFIGVFFSIALVAALLLSAGLVPLFLAKSHGPA